MPGIKIQKLRQECQRILAYTEGLTMDALQRDTSLGDAVFLRIQRLYDLGRAALAPGCAAPGDEIGLLRSELAMAQARIAELEAGGQAQSENQAPAAQSAPTASLHPRVAPSPPPTDDENLTFLGLAKK